MIGTKISKSDFDGGLYAECAVWCNANNATIEDKGDYYECASVPPLSIEELKKRAKSQEFILPTHAPEMIDLINSGRIIGK